MTIAVLPINDIPTFELPDAVVVEEGSSAYSQSDIAFNISRGSWFEDAHGEQTRTFEVVVVSHTPDVGVSIFAVDPELSANGTLTFELIPEGYGNVTLNVTLKDSGGTERGGVDTSETHSMMVIVSPLNQQPLFHLSSLRVIVAEDSGVNIIGNFAVNISKGNFFEDFLQLLSFEVDPSGVDSEVFVNRSVFISPEGSLRFQTLSNAYGNTTFNVSLVDNGRDGASGLCSQYCPDASDSMRSSTRQFIIEILPVNDKPVFVLQSHHIQLLEEFELEPVVRYVHNFSRSMVSGPANEAEQTLTFSVVPLTAQIPTEGTVSFNSSTDLSKLYDDEADGQLFEPGYSVNVSVGGTLSLLLAKFRHGTVNFTITLADDGGTTNAGMDRSDPVLFQLEVIPVNSRPLFHVPTFPLEFLETEHAYVYHAQSITGVWQGGWKEERDQVLSFAVTQTYGAVGLGLLTVSCIGGEFGCGAGNATIDFQTIESRFGEARYTITIMDNGGTEFGGITFSEQEVYIKVLPVNDAPSFRLSAGNLQVNEDSSCFTDVALEVGFTGDLTNKNCSLNVETYDHTIENFVTAISLGPWENSEDECHPILCNTSETGGCPRFPAAVSGCESQTGHFTVLPQDVQTATYLFGSGGMPTISFDGTLRFKTQQDAHGATMFNVSLRDSGGLEATHEFLLTVHQVNDIPAFEIVQTIILYEDFGVIERDIVNSVSSGAGELTDGNKLTFNIAMTSEERSLFAPGVYPAINASSGRLSLTLSEEAFGHARLQVTLSDDGDAGKSPDQQNLRELDVVVCPVNDAPTFSLKDRVDALENSGFQAYQTASSIVPGPPNERCREVSPFCQSQQVTFTVTDLSNPSLFVSMPVFSAGGSLSFSPAPHASGATMISVRAMDDGQSFVPAGCEYQGTDTSQTLQTVLVIVPVNDPPTFTLPWHISCTSPEKVKRCACDLPGHFNDVCKPKNDTSSVAVLQASGAVAVKNFVTDVSPAFGFRSGYLSYFEPLPNINDCEDSDYGLDCVERPHMRFDGPIPDPITSSAQFEYSVATVTFPSSPRRDPTDVSRYVYSVDFETDTVSAFAVDGNNNTRLIDRRVDGENRLRFAGFTPYPSLNSLPKQVVSASSVCEWKSFEIDGRQLAASASGCVELQEHVLVDADDCEAVLQSFAPCNTAKQIIGTAIGSWDFSSSSNSGNMFVNDFSAGYRCTCTANWCTFSRPRRQDGGCQEMYPMVVRMAAIRDSSNKLGAAVLTGPACKNDTAADWDRPEEETPTISTFLMNNGLVEALQFDGVLNRGLLITDNLGRLSLNLPRNAMSVEVWFAVSSGEIPFGGLVSLLQETEACSRGWGLGVGNVKGNSFFVQLTIALEDNAHLDEKLVIVRAVTSFDLGTWVHVVATYDGERASIFIDTHLMASSQACSSPPCGYILYPTSTELIQCTTPTKFNIGTYLDVTTEQEHPFFGAIKNIRIFDRHLEDTEIGVLFETYASELKSSPITAYEYWVKQTSHAGPTTKMLSPDTTHSLATDSNGQLAVRGTFQTTTQYRCAFRHRNLLAVSTGNGTLVCTGSSCDQLRCTIPFWVYGFRGAVLGVQRWDPAVEKWTAMWQRVCLSASCGFLPSKVRTASWWTYGSHNSIHPGMEGTKAIHRFRLESHLFEFDQLYEDLNSMSSFAEATTLPGDGSDFMNASRMSGASSFTHFKSHSQNFLMAANFWDGTQTATSSPIYKLIGNPPSVQTVQSVSTDGARKWQYLALGDCEFVALSSFVEGLKIYPWNSSKSLPLDEMNVMAFPRSAGASALELFYVDNAVYLIVSRFFDSGSYVVDSHIYQVQVAHANSCQLSVSEHQQLPTVGANDVKYMMIDGVHYLAIASSTADEGTMLFAWGPDVNHPYPWGAGSEAPDFRLAQSLPTRNASSIEHFTVDSHYLVVTQSANTMIMFRWNKTMFLAEVNDKTLPRDSAGGQRFPNIVARATTAFTARDSQTTYLLTSIKTGDEITTSKSLLWRGRREVLPHILNGPNSIAISPDGLFVYIACLHSRSIAVFHRNNITGGLVYSSGASSFGPWNSVVMIQQIAMSLDGYNVYATANSDNAVLTFERNAQNGSLHLRQIISDGMKQPRHGSPGDALDYMQNELVDGLDGAYSLSLSVSGESVYVGSLQDRAIVLLKRQDDGLLAYVDRIKEGERLWTSFQRDIDDKPWELPSSSYASSSEYEKLWSKTPYRLGGNAVDKPWTFTAQDLASFDIEGNLHVAVASSDVDPFSQGVVSIYRWKRESFSLLQELHDETGASAVTYFSRMVGFEGKTTHFIVVANGFKTTKPEATISVYQWDADSYRFMKHHSLTHSHSSGSDRLLYASALECFTIVSGGEEISYLAVAHLWDGVTTRTPSSVYRWNPEGSRLLENGKRLVGTGFEWHQDLVDTMAASDVNFYSFINTSGLLVVANSQSTADIGNGGGSVGIFELNATSNRFEKIQSLESVGAADVEPFSISGEGEFLAIAHRQSGSFVLPPAEKHRDDPIWEAETSIYDQDSVIWKWDASERQFSIYQRLGANISTVSETGGSIIDRLRGVTGFKAFSSRGETYLAVAQSVCDTLLGDGREHCLRHQMQPKSAILQWNRVEKKFGELLSMTDEDNMQLRSGKRVEDDDLTIHSFAMRMSAGRAQGWDVVPGSTGDLLMCISLTRGVLVYNWDFKRAVGFGGIVGIVSDFKDEVVYAVARADDAILAFSKGILRDDVNRTVHSCPNDGCLKYEETRSENKISQNEVQEVDRFKGTTGLSGAVSVTFAIVPGFPRGALVVGSSLFRDELRCSTNGPIPANVEGDFGLGPECQDVAFETEMIASSNDLLFLVSPNVDRHGTLTFEANPAESGSARLAIQARDSSKNSLGISVSLRQEFLIQVTPLNQPPRFHIVQENLRVSDGVESSFIFAVNVDSGADREIGQSLKWVFSYNCPDMFTREPSFSVVNDQGYMVGKMDVSVRDFRIGACRFNMTLVDNGISSSNGDRNTSDTVPMVLDVVQRNRPPQFEHLDELRISAGDQTKVIPAFARLISSGSFYETNQNVSFYLEKVTLNGRPVNGLFDSFMLDVNGTLIFQERANTIGEYVVTLKSMDDAGTARGGVDTSYSSFVLRLQFSDDLRPALASPGILAIPEADFAIEQVFGSFFQVANLRRFEQPTSLVVTKVSNPSLFVVDPRADPSGSLTVELKPYEFGESNLTVILIVGDQTCANGSTPDICIASVPHVVTVSVFTWNRSPSFVMPDFLGSVEDAGEQIVRAFASEVSAGPFREADQKVRFDVTVSVSSGEFFSIVPDISPSGDLRFEVLPGKHGTAVLNVTAMDDGGLTMEANASTSDTLVLKVFPKPHISSVVPRFGKTTGGNTITVRGAHFGSEYSRGYVASTYGDISVFVGGERCLETTFVSDQAVMCVAPPGVGQGSVSVNISDGAVTRSGVLESGYAHNFFYAGGSWTQPRSAGFVAHSPLFTSSGVNGNNVPSLGAANIVAAKTVRALNVFQGLLYVGGDFMGLNGADARFIFAWDGASATKLDNGVDGAVLGLLSFKNQLVVAGAFTHVFKQWGSVRTGGLAIWDGQQWAENPHGAIINGVVTTLATNGTVLYIGGRFENVGSLTTHGIAMWDGEMWSALEHAGLSGDVSALIAASSLLYVAGIFRSSGDVDEETSQIVRWDGGSPGWYSLGVIQGRVNALEVYSESLYVGGDFSRVGLVSTANLAVFRSGRWHSVGGGLNGAVHALLFSNSCLYIGGSFSRIYKEGSRAEDGAALYAARYCGQQLQGLEPFSGMGTVHVLASA